jgi:hypothetical protein
VVADGKGCMTIIAYGYCINIFMGHVFLPGMMPLPMPTHASLGPLPIAIGNLSPPGALPSPSTVTMVRLKNAPSLFEEKERVKRIDSHGFFTKQVIFCLAIFSSLQLMLSHFSRYTLQEEKICNIMKEVLHRRRIPPILNTVKFV